MKKIDDIFYIRYGVSLELISCNITTPDKGIPFVARTSRNNVPLLQGHYCIVPQ